jgi:hypothetical protein
MSNPHKAAPYVAPILPGSEDYRQIRMTEMMEPTAAIERMVAVSRELPPMATGDPPMHPIARAMIAVADETMALFALTEVNPDDPGFQHAAAAAVEAEAEATKVVSAAIDW